MANIRMSAEAEARLRDLLEEEGGDACARLREFTIGSG